MFNNIPIETSFQTKKKSRFIDQKLHKTVLWKLHDLGPLYRLGNCKDSKSNPHRLIFICGKINGI